MSDMQAALLAGRGVVEVGGPGTRDFLQNIVTVDVAPVAPGAARHGALLTPQGKILFAFFVFSEEEERFLLDAPAALAAELAKRLMFYRLRAKLDIAVRDDLAVVALWGGAAPPDIDGAAPDPRLAALGWRALLPGRAAEAAIRDAGAVLADEAAYDAHRVAHGIAELGRDYATGDLFPHEADLDQLGGVSFEKGCFVGQEVVSRMQHRGTARKRFVPAETTGPLPAPGAGVTANGRALGVTGSGADGRVLALLRLDRVGQALAAGAPLVAGETRLTPVRPDWARFPWPGEAAS